MLRILQLVSNRVSALSKIIKINHESQEKSPKNHNKEFSILDHDAVNTTEINKSNKKRTSKKHRGCYWPRTWGRRRRRRKRWKRWKRWKRRKRNNSNDSLLSRV